MLSGALGLCLFFAFFYSSVLRLLENFLCFSLGLLNPVESGVRITAQGMIKVSIYKDKHVCNQRLSCHVTQAAFFPFVWHIALIADGHLVAKTLAQKLEVA